MVAPAFDFADGPRASLVLERLLATLPEDRVSLGWLHRELRDHSFEMFAFILSLIAILPGASVFIGILMIVPALGMVCASGWALPSVVADRSVSARQASYVIGHAIPWVRSWEDALPTLKFGAHSLVRPCVGLLLLVLSATLLIPVPLSNVPPAIVMAGLSLASFQRNLLLLGICGVAAALSLAFSCMTLLAASAAFASVFP